MKLTIDKNVPIPQPPTGGGVASQMEVGDSVFCPTVNDAVRVAKLLKRLYGEAASLVREEGPGWRVWRVL